MTLTSFFEPESVAVIGATDRAGSVGGTLMNHLLHGPSTRRSYAVNPKRATVFGLTCYPAIRAVPEKVDLVVIVTPAATVPELAGECVKAGVKGVIVISAGFRERGTEGTLLERKIQEQ